MAVEGGSVGVNVPTLGSVGFTAEGGFSAPSAVVSSMAPVFSPMNEGAVSGLEVNVMSPAETGLLVGLFGQPVISEGGPEVQLAQEIGDADSGVAQRVEELANEVGVQLSEETAQLVEQLAQPVTEATVLDGEESARVEEFAEPSIEESPAEVQAESIEGEPSEGDVTEESAEDEQRDEESSEDTNDESGEEQPDEQDDQEDQRKPQLQFQISLATDIARMGLIATLPLEGGENPSPTEAAWRFASLAPKSPVKGAENDGTVIEISSAIAKAPATNSGIVTAGVMAAMHNHAITIGENGIPVSSDQVIKVLGFNPSTTGEMAPMSVVAGGGGLRRNPVTSAI